jgi:hypothetical protein
MAADHIHNERKLRGVTPKLSGKLTGRRPGLQTDMNGHARFDILRNGLT